MAKESNSAVSLLAAGVIAVTGLIPVAWILTTPETEPTVAETVVVDQTTTTAVAEVTTVVVDPVPELGVEELDVSIVRVLQANGYAELKPETEVGEELPPAVTRLLIDRGAVLTVVEEDPIAGEG